MRADSLLPEKLLVVAVLLMLWGFAVLAMASIFHGAAWSPSPAPAAHFLRAMMSAVASL